MYNKFFGLAEAPFNITPDSRFLFLSQRHREALGALVYGVKERKGFIVLTGEIGSGKTTICRALIHELKSDNIKLAVVLNPGLSELELLKTINDEFQIPSFYDTKKGLVDALNSFLINETQKGNNVVLIIDEAQNLEPALLEQIRMLSNLETEDAKLIQIVLIGQPELNDTLHLSQLEQLNQRVAVRYHITALNEDEVLAYIKHRLFVARAKIDIEFTEGAINIAYAATRGVPRKLNVLCDRALLACYAAGSYTVDDQIALRAVQEVAGEMPAAVAHTKPARIASATSRALTRKVVIGAAAALAVMLLMVAAVAAGIKFANLNAQAANSPRPADANHSRNQDGDDDKQLIADGKGGEQGTGSPTAGGDGKSTEPEVKAAPTPPPNLDEIRRNNPHWQYEKNSPLVRVNKPKAVFRAAQFTLLKLWGFPVELGEIPKIGEDQILQGDLNFDKFKIYHVSLGDDFYAATRLNVPMIAKIRNPSPDQSDHMVILKAEGEVVTVGDPVWGITTFKTKDFLEKWNGASSMFVDVKQLGTIRKGDKSERVRELQEFLRAEGYLDEVTGVFDVKTTDAIRKLQGYYKLPDTGQLDEKTMMVLNSRMIRNGPRLSEG